MSLTLNERFSHLPPPNIHGAGRLQPQQQTVHVNLGGGGGRTQQQLSSGRTIGIKKAKQVQTKSPRLNVKQRGISGSAARADRRLIQQARVANTRVQKLAQQRAQPQQPRPQLFIPAPVAPMQPFQLAPQFTQSTVPVFNIGATKQQVKALKAATNGNSGTNKKGTNKKTGGNQTQSNKKQGGNKPVNRQAAAKKKANGPAAAAGGAKKNAKRGAKGAKANGPVSQENLDADLDTYMAAAPSN